MRPCYAQSMAHKNKKFETLIEVKSHGILKNRKKIMSNRQGKRWIGTDDEVVSLKRDLVCAFRFNPHRPLEMFTEYVNVKMIFYFPDDKFYLKQKRKADFDAPRVRSKNVADLSNLYQIVEDALQDAFIIEDDYLIESHNGSLRAPSSLVGASDRYYLKIEITCL